MTREDLIANCNMHIGAAYGCAQLNDHTHYAEHMHLLLDLLIEELISPPPKSADRPAGKFNPEQVLEQIATAIRHRTISSTHRWAIVYYHTRITCVPTHVCVPSEIILHEFTDKMANNGFSTCYWNHLKQNVIKLYKELKT